MFRIFVRGSLFIKAFYSFFCSFLFFMSQLRSKFLLSSPLPAGSRPSEIRINDNHGLDRALPLSALTELGINALDAPATNQNAET